MEIQKAYFTLPEILERWAISEADMVYLAEKDELRLSLRVFGLPVEFVDCEATPDGQPHQIPWEQDIYSGLLDLHACDVFQLFRCGEIQLREFRTPRAGYAVLWGEGEAALVMIGDLLMRREERDRFELEHGFSSGEEGGEAGAFIASADYQDIRCNGRRFKLGRIQAEAVRLLHEAALAGEPWQSGKAILASAGSKSLRMADVFKSQQDWRQLIRSDRRGGYRLDID